MLPFIALFLVVIPLVTLTVAVIDTHRASGRSGGYPPASFTYRAYGA